MDLTQIPEHLQNRPGFIVVLITAVIWTIWCFIVVNSPENKENEND